MKSFMLLGACMLVFCSRAWGTTPQIENDTSNNQTAYVVEDSISEEHTTDNILQLDVLENEAPVLSEDDIFNDNEIGVFQNVSQPKGKSTRNKQKDKRINNKQERQQKKIEDRQKKCIEKTKKKEIIQQQKEKRTTIADKRNPDKGNIQQCKKNRTAIPNKESIPQQDQEQYQNTSHQLDTRDEKEITSEVEQKDVVQEKNADSATSNHTLRHFLICIGIVWIIGTVWKFLMNGLHRRCKKCGKWWALQEIDRELIDSWEEDERITLHDKNSKGEVFRTREGLQRVRISLYRVYWKCKYCGEEYTSTCKDKSI